MLPRRRLGIAGRIVLVAAHVEDNPPKYPDTTSGEHLMAKLMGPRAGDEVDVDDAFMAPIAP